MNRLITATTVVCLLASAVHADPRKADDALELGTTIDRKLPNFEGFLYEKLMSGACLIIPPSLEREDMTLVKVIISEVNTDVWEVRTDEGRTLYVPYDREPGI